MLKVGDKVRVREDLIYDRNEPGVTDVMLGFRGKEMTIKEVIKDREYYIFLEDEPEHYWTEEMFEKIEEKESNNMKELTFREVIANIKEDEIWEGREYTITLLGNRIAINYNDGDEYNGVYPLIEGTFKLKRPQYTFQEAFKAFEEGKEIESCVTNCVYSKELTTTYLENLICFTPKEIRNKWYIND